MSGFPVIEQDGVCASVSTQRAPTCRWVSWVSFERDSYFARLKHHHVAEPHRVPNDYPSEESAVLAAYSFARELISKEQVH